MHHQKHAEIRLIMHSYIAKGTKSLYKNRQMKRLFAAIEDIFKHEGTERLTAIGKRQLIGFWRRNNDSDKIRYEKYLILREFFSRSNPSITVPKPRPIDKQ
jgi:hypothetical protein